MLSRLILFVSPQLPLLDSLANWFGTDRQSKGKDYCGEGMGDFFAEAHLFRYVFVHYKAAVNIFGANIFCYLKAKSWQMIKL